MLTSLVIAVSGVEDATAAQSEVSRPRSDSLTASLVGTIVLKAEQ